ncbi:MULTISPECIES: hypothetical protein [unclassified Streptomyces]|uniref:hypothetical protein n=1 Tax=unclassified Streptomyces TaxID=2593676 RepID=UPI0036510CD4
MRETMLALVALNILAAGYLLGRLRPYVRLADWTNWQLTCHRDRWLTRPRQVALLGLLLLTDPVNTISAWRNSQEPRR